MNIDHRTGKASSSIRREYIHAYYGQKPSTTPNTLFQGASSPLSDFRTSHELDLMGRPRTESLYPTVPHHDEGRSVEYPHPGRAMFATADRPPDLHDRRSLNTISSSIPGFENFLDSRHGPGYSLSTVSALRSIPDPQVAGGPSYMSGIQNHVGLMQSQMAKHHSETPFSAAQQTRLVTQRVEPQGPDEPSSLIPSTAFRGLLRSPGPALEPPLAVIVNSNGGDTSAGVDRSVGYDFALSPPSIPIGQSTQSPSQSGWINVTLNVDANLPRGPTSNISRTALTKRKVKMHECEICGKGFPRPSGLKTHMNIHNNVKPFRCVYPGCDKMFTVRSNAKRHLRTHGSAPTPSDAKTAQHASDFAGPDVAGLPHVPKQGVNPAPLKLRWMSPNVITKTGFRDAKSVSDADSDSDDDSLRSQRATMLLDPVFPSPVIHGRQDRLGDEEGSSYQEVQSHPRQSLEFGATWFSYLGLRFLQNYSELRAFGRFPSHSDLMMF